MSEPTPEEPLRVALLGCGVVGTEVVRLLTTQAAILGFVASRALPFSQAHQPFAV